AMDINMAGQVAGYRTVAGGTHGFRYADGTGFQDIGTLGGPSSFAWFIDETGTIYGSAQTPTSPPIGSSDISQFGHAVIYNDLVGLFDLNNVVDPALDLTLIFADSPAGDWLPVEGEFGGAAPRRAFRMRLSTGAIEQIGSWPGNMLPIAATSYGDVVGSGQRDSSSTYSAWLFNDQLGLVDLNDVIDPASGWHLSFAQSVNDSGDVVGQGVHDGQLAAFRLRLPLRTTTSGGPAVAVAHTYGYDGLRT